MTSVRTFSSITLAAGADAPFGLLALEQVVMSGQPGAIARDDR